MSNDLKMETTSAVDYVQPEEGIFMTYANNMNYGFTAGDMRIVFGEIIDMQKGKATVEQRVQVTLSWMSAKILSTMLGALVAQHEKTVGPVNIPPALLEVNKL
jgi:hypothetical protein